MADVTLKTWRKEVSDRLERFERCWEIWRNESPEYHPDKMSKADWDEQFGLFMLALKDD